MELYYTDKKNIFSTYLRITGTEAHHITRVMRHKQGDMLYVTDGEGNEFQTMLKSFENKSVDASIINRTRKARETKTNVTLAQSIIKGNHMDFIIEKATELGVQEIIPVITERTIARVSVNKIDRYQKLILAAMKSSTRTRLPYITKPVSFEKLLETTASYDLALLAWEDEKHNRLSNVLSNDFLNKVLLIIGPEGGFTEKEVTKAKAYGVKCFTMGPRRLRAETAAVSALSLLLYELKEM
jgi:16S rRNA (uracil1498-N3)-methyltransferase